MEIVFDIEANGFIENVTKIHCLCYKGLYDDQIKGALTDYSEIRELFNIPNLVAWGHNVVRYDIPVLEKILGIKINIRLVDTLALSWYCFPTRTIHGLDEWSKDFAMEKPKILDWEGLSMDEYIDRCKKDVMINRNLAYLELRYLLEIYDSQEDVDRFINYTTFKLDCAKEQEIIKWKADKEKITNNFAAFMSRREEKIRELEKSMPRQALYSIRSKPKVMFKKDGAVSELGYRWQKLLEEQELPEYYNGAVKVKVGEKAGNPSSTEQVKKWLFTMGWEPETFKHVKEWEGGREVLRPIPQISSDDGSGICSSIKRMYVQHPELVALEDLQVINHRVGLLKGFLRDMDADNNLQAQISGLTNTLRFQHKTIVNLPQIPKKYWREVRECLIAPNEDWELCGADMSSLEDNTKQHYMFFFDPDYVRELRVPGFDPHLDIAIMAGYLSKEQAEMHKLYDRTKGAQGVSFKAIRLKAKKGNFAAVYGAGAPKLSITLNIPLSEARKFWAAYWIRNRAVKQVAESLTTKVVDGQKWLFNPVSQFWYSLRAEKDRFSTLNQSTAVYCFDTWVRHIRAIGYKICGQFHDEVVIPIERGKRDQVTRDLRIAIERANKDLVLNVPLNISIDYGDNYANIH